MAASTSTISETTAVHLGIKYVRWGLSLFIFGLVMGYGPLLHYLHGGSADVQPAFLKKVTLWWGCPWTLASYVAQLGSLAMVVFGLCYLVTGRDDRTTPSGGEQWGPTLCALGILTEFAFGYLGYFIVNRVWPNFYFTPIDAGKWTWLGIQGVCITIFLFGAILGQSGIKRRLQNWLRPSEIEQVK